MKYGRLVHMDIFTDAYRVTGQVSIRGGGLQGELGDPNTDYLEVHDTYISRIHQPGEIIASYNLGSFRKDNINFIVLQDRRDGVPVGSTHGTSVFNRGRPVPAFLTVPSFEIHGEVMYDGKPNPGAVLIHSPGRFQAVFAAEAAASLYPEITYSGDLVMVHKDRIGVFCLGNET
jgi:hypothetical protein